MTETLFATVGFRREVDQLAARYILDGKATPETARCEAEQEVLRRRRAKAAAREQAEAERPPVCIAHSPLDFPVCNAYTEPPAVCRRPSLEGISVAP